MLHRPVSPAARFLLAVFSVSFTACAPTGRTLSLSTQPDPGTVRSAVPDVRLPARSSSNGANPVSNDTAVGEVLAEREYEATDINGGAPRKVVLRIGMPRPDPQPGGDWVCPVQVVGMGDDDVLEVPGVDAVQALHLAMAMAGVRLTYPPKGTTITWLGGPDLGLPLPGPAGADFTDEDTEEQDD